MLPSTRRAPIGANTSVVPSRNVARNTAEGESATHTISVVIPVYGGERTLASVVQELDRYREPSRTEMGHVFRVCEVVLAWDHGQDGSERVIRHLESANSHVRAVWLTRNYGQHAATMAGIEASVGDWVVTLDEDGQHDPAFIPKMLDTAMTDQAPLVYARPINKPSHGFLRNTASRVAKVILSSMLGNTSARVHQSYRLVLGSLGRRVVEQTGAGVYLDVALSWIAPTPSTTDVLLRDEGDRVSGYSTRRLFSHFWRMVLTSGTRGLRVVSALGALFAGAGLALTIAIVIAYFAGSDFPHGWASTVIVVLVSSGAILFALGTISEYIGVTVNRALGRPLYVVGEDPHRSALGRRPATGVEGDRADSLPPDLIP